ncbi:MAG: esterase/lipase family protein [Mycetocola sp.]
MVDAVATVLLHLRIVTLPRVPRHYSDGDRTLPEVVVVPGVYEPWWFMSDYAELLNANGYRVRVVHGLGYNLRGIVETAELLARALRRTAPPAAGRLIVGHSKGGLIGKQLLRYREPALGIIGVVAVATPFGGSRLARQAIDPHLRIFSPRNPTIVELGRDAVLNENIVSIYGMFDPDIPEGSVLSDATNIPVPATGHMSILRDSHAAEAVLYSAGILGPHRPEARSSAAVPRRPNKK